MRGRVVVALCAALAFPALAGGPSLSERTAVAEISRLESVWNEAHLRGDARALEALWADDLVVIVPGMAPMTKSQVLAFAESGRMTFTAYETADVTIRTFDRTAIASGNLHRSRVLDGNTVDDRWRFMKVYANLRRHWQVVAFFAADGSKP